MAKGLWVGFFKRCFCKVKKTTQIYTDFQLWRNVVMYQIVTLESCFFMVRIVTVVSCYISSCYVASLYVASCDVASCYVASCFVASCVAASSVVASCYVANCKGTKKASSMGRPFTKLLNSCSCDYL
jgi:hypothetical protein